MHGLKTSVRQWRRDRIAKKLRRKWQYSHRFLLNEEYDFLCAYAYRRDNRRMSLQVAKSVRRANRKKAAEQYQQKVETTAKFINAGILAAVVAAATAIFWWAIH